VSSFVGEGVDQSTWKGPGVQWVFLVGGQQRKSVESTHEGDGEERHSRPQSTSYLRTASQKFSPRDRQVTS
jgi:hypothetical protein